MSEHYDVIKLGEIARTDEKLIRKLDVDSDLDFAILKSLVGTRESVSSKLGFRNPNLLLFMLLYPFRDQIYYLEEQSIVIVLDDSGEQLKVHDIITAEMPRFTDIESFIANFQKREVAFIFSTDKLALKGVEKRKVEDSVLFINGDFDFDERLIFPSSIRA